MISVMVISINHLVVSYHVLNQGLDQLVPMVLEFEYV